MNACSVAAVGGWLLLVAAPLPTIAGPLDDTRQGADECRISQIRLDKVRAINEGSVTTSVFGVLLNSCAVATGPQIKVVFYDGAGNILRVEDVWPASTNDIPARSNFPFQLKFTRVQGFEKVDVRVIGTRTWGRSG